MTGQTPVRSSTLTPTVASADKAHFNTGTYELRRPGPVGVNDREQRRLGSITKTGSAHARRLLVEAALALPHNARASARRSTDDRSSQPPEAVAIAWTAQRRLHRTWTRLEARKKRRTLIAVAAARELVGFCWAITQIE